MKTSKQKSNQTSETELCPMCNRPVGTAESVHRTADDFKHALLIVSILINLFGFTTWLVVQSSSSYAVAVANYLGQ